MNTRLENLILSGAVALAVSTAVSGASPSQIQAPTHGIAQPALSAASGPSLADKFEALSKRFDRLQVRESQDRSNINQVALAAQDATDVTGCITSALYLVKDDATGAFVDGDLSDPSGDYVPTLDAACVTQDTP